MTSELSISSGSTCLSARSSGNDRFEISVLSILFQALRICGRLFWEDCQSRVSLGFCCWHGPCKLTLEGLNPTLPLTIALTANSVFLPFSVTGMSCTWNVCSGTCRAEYAAFMALLSSAMCERSSCTAGSRILMKSRTRSCSSLPGLRWPTTMLSPTNSNLSTTL